MILRKLTTIGAVLLCLHVSAQEFVTSLYENPVLREKAKQDSSSRLKSASESSLSYYKLIDLPFYDDFARPQVLPELSLWCDKYAYINTVWGVSPPNIGVASLDALDASGKLFAKAGASQFDADTLTSFPINTATYTPKIASSVLYLKRGSEYQRISDSMYYKVNKSYYLLTNREYWFEAKDTIYRKKGDVYTAVLDTVYTLNGVTPMVIPGSKEHKNQWLPYKASDSLYLSFYYQAGGNATAPNKEGDSLVLEAYMPYKLATGIKINEFTNQWIELYNANDVVVDVANYYLVSLDSIQDKFTEKFQITSAMLPTTLIAPAGHLVIKTASLKGLANFPKKRKRIELWDTKKQFCDSVKIELKDSDSIQGAIGRVPDGGVWGMPEPSPMQPNGAWKQLWGTKQGSASSFTFVRIPLVDTFLTKGFRFRFHNYASLSGDLSHARNEDVWNIDNVYLSAHNNINQPNYADVGLCSNYSSIMTEFTSVPYKHLESMNSDKIHVFMYSDIRNLDTIVRKINYKWISKKQIGTPQIDSVSLLSREIPAWMKKNNWGLYSDTVYFTEVADFNIADVFSRSVSTDSLASFDLKFFITDNESPIHAAYRWNDTIRRRQDFFNYYAYDDGSAEMGYGVRGAIGSQVAYKFTTLKKDVLTGVKIYFNPTTYPSNRIFSLCVWTNENNKPGKLIYQKAETAKYLDGLFKFVTYPIDTSGIIDKKLSSLPADNSFFIGWQQYQDFELNVGMDVNNKLSQRLFYNVDNDGWQKSKQSEALMIRPLFGADVYVSKSETLHDFDISLYPNPAQNELHLALNSASDITISEFTLKVHSLLGCVLLETRAQESISLSELPAGIYMVQITAPNGDVISKKLIKR